MLTIAWQDFPCILKQITAASVQECRVVIFSENVNQTESYLTGNGCGGPVPMDSVEIVDAPSNSIWIRDYGANTVYTDWNDGRVLVDWIYNRNRPDDDAIPDDAIPDRAVADDSPTGGQYRTHHICCRKGGDNPTYRGRSGMRSKNHTKNHTKI